MMKVWDGNTTNITLYESDSFISAKEKCGSARVMDEVMFSVDMTLGQNPFYGEAVWLTRELFTFRTRDFSPRVPSFRILYSYSSEKPKEITLLHIEPEEPNHDD